jgi:hypothetical protein
MNKLKVIQLDKQLPSIEVPSPFEKAIDPTQLDEQLATTGKQQLRHARTQLAVFCWIMFCHVWKASTGLRLASTN